MASDVACATGDGLIADFALPGEMFALPRNMVEAAECERLPRGMNKTMALAAKGKGASAAEANRHDVMLNGCCAAAFVAGSSHPSYLYKFVKSRAHSEQFRTQRRQLAREVPHQAVALEPQRHIVSQG